MNVDTPDTANPDTGFTGTLVDYLTWLESRLQYGGLCISGPQPHEAAASFSPDRLVRRVEVVTGGYSEDEALLARVRRGMLAMHWLSSHRGGLDVYEIPADQYAWDMELPWLAPDDGVFERIARARTLVVHGLGYEGTPLRLEIDLPHGAELTFTEPDRDIAEPAGVLTVAAITPTEEQP